MMRHSLRLALLMMGLVLGFVVITLMPGGMALAQAVDGVPPGNTTAATAADADLWRAVRAGDVFTTANPNPQSGMLIQSAGHVWQQFREGPLSLLVSVILGATLILLCLFFVLRGRVRIESGKSDRTIARFTLVERSAHWTLAISFILLGLTGLNLLFGRKVILPWLGHDAFSAMTIWGKFIHNYVAFAFIAALIVVAVLWVAHNLPSRTDVMWLLRGGGLFGGGHPPAWKFNAGQKLIFWSVILCGASLAISGWALLNPFTTTMMADTFGHVNALLGTGLPTDLTPIEEQQFQATWHTIMAAIMLAIIFAHIYIGTVGMEGALDAMTTGEVDENWAREHHSLWVEQIEEQEATARRKGGYGSPAE